MSFKHKDTTGNFIVCEKFNKLSDSDVKYNNEMNKKNKIFWDEKLNFLYTKYNEILKNINNFIGDIDVSSTNAFNSIKYNYCRPEIVESEKSLYFSKRITTSYFRSSCW